MSEHTDQPKHQELPPLPSKARGDDWHDYWKLCVAVRTDQLLDAQRQLTEKDARIAELEATNARLVEACTNACDLWQRHHS